MVATRWLEFSSVISQLTAAMEMQSTNFSKILNKK
jgi:hypothetical protein